MRSTIGIDSIGVYVPRLYLDLTDEWAKTRAPVLAGGDVQKLVGKVTDGVGVRRMAVVDAHQDCATLAAMAAKRAIDAAGIDPREIDYLAVGTETTVDQSKSTAAYVLGMLEQHYGVRMPDVGAPQFQFACIGATYALEAAVSRIRAGDHVKPYSLVIASDVSKYPLATPGEYTQGAGAVALLVSENPRLLALEPGLSATITRDERDFFRPNWSATAVVDGKYSIDVYLDTIEAAFHAYAERIEGALGIVASRLYGAIDHFLFHVPFPRMAEYAAARVFLGQWLADTAPGGARSRLVAEVPGADADACAATGVPLTGDAAVQRKEVERLFAKSAVFREAFARKVKPSLGPSRDIGNMYSGSLYLALASLFEHARSHGPASGSGGSPLAGQRIAFGSYGSGASAKVFSGTVMADHAKVTSHLRLADELRSRAEGGTRVPLSIADYERLHALADAELEGDSPAMDAVMQKLRDGVSLTPAEVAAIGALRAAVASPKWRVRPRGASILAPSAEFALERIGTTSSAERTDTGYRYYAWVP
jgi:hydroxymethylglutaryl-CoA synthase